MGRLQDEELNNKYTQWLLSHKKWLCANSSRLDEVLENLLNVRIITEEDKKRIEKAGSMTTQFSITYDFIIKSGVDKIDTVIECFKKACQEDVTDEFINFKEQNMQTSSMLSQILNTVNTTMCVSDVGINEKYKQWIHNKMNWLCDNSSKIDEVLSLLISKDFITPWEKENVESVKGYQKQFTLIYDLIKQKGVDQIESVIEVMGQTNEDIQEEFIEFKKQHNLQSSGKKRTTEDRPLVNFNKLKKVYREDSGEDTLDFVNNMQPLVVEVKLAKGFMEIDNKYAYKMRSDPRGYALIINNIHFQDPMRNRTGAAERDRDYTKQLLQQLNYRVTVKEDVKSTELEDFLNSFKEKFEDNAVDSCIVVVMSHGGNNTLEMSDGAYVQIWQDFIYKFDNIRCPQLLGKPKIFIIQACQNFEERKSRTDTDATFAKVSDILVTFSTIPGHVSHRDKFLGSWYIYCLTKVFMENAHNMEITKLLQKLAIETMMNMKSEDDIKQVSTYQPILFRDFYFNPGL